MVVAVVASAICHCEARSNEAISVLVRNYIELASTLRASQ
jgi:hypothetical protein